MKVDSAIIAATVKATVVKNPKTFCTRTTAECIVKGFIVEGQQRDVDSCGGELLTRI
jgi:hypothetical protein